MRLLLVVCFLHLSDLDSAATPKNKQEGLRMQEGKSSDKQGNLEGVVYATRIKNNNNENKKLALKVMCALLRVKPCP